MKRLLPLLFAVTLAFTACVEDEPECPDDDEEIACTCADGAEGELICANGTAQCYCGDTNNDDNGNDDE